ncbi:hypothetical protein [uncultured Brevundimonas sp.]|jgi:hypothetical protein|nr:hypothetical protein [uncultured Brevundimonas sp.]
MNILSTVVELEMGSPICARQRLKPLSQVLSETVKLQSGIALSQADW